MFYLCIPYYLNRNRYYSVIVYFSIVGYLDVIGNCSDLRNCGKSKYVSPTISILFTVFADHDDAVIRNDALLALCEGNPPVTVGFLHKRSIMRTIYVFNFHRE